MKRITTIIAAIMPLSLMAQDNLKKSDLDSPMGIFLLFIIGSLMLAITVLGTAVIGAAGFYLEKYKEMKEKAKNEGAKVLSVIILLMINCTAFAQIEPGTPAPVSAPFVSGMSDSTFVIMMGIIFLESIVIVILARFMQKFIKLDFESEMRLAEGRVAVEHKEPLWKRLWIKANNFRSLKEEAAIDLGHDYDGIRELDNRLPGWWLYGFIITIIFSCIYLLRYEVIHSAPGTIEEYNIAVTEAAEKQEAYLLNAANNVDENSVKFLSESSDLEAGKKVFEAVCAACHKKDGGGLVGPNLTDDYWLHGGSIQDIFKSIKYGWPEKGMKSWKDDYSPRQLAQIASYIKTLHGTNPPGALEKQGELYQEKETTPAAPSADTTTKKTEIKVAQL